MTIEAQPTSIQAQLVEGIQRGDLASESTFVKKYRQGLVIMLEQRTRDRARAEDLAHDALLTVLSKIRASEIDDPNLLTRYVYQTAKYIHIGWQRKKGNQAELKDSFDDEASLQKNQEYDLIRQQQVKLAKQLMHEMSVERDRELLLRYYVHEQTKPIVCDALKLSSQHFDRVLNRARKRFKELVEQRQVDLSID